MTIVYASYFLTSRENILGPLLRKMKTVASHSRPIQCETLFFFIIHIAHHLEKWRKYKSIENTNKSSTTISSIGTFTQTKLLIRINNRSHYIPVISNTIRIGNRGKMDEQHTSLSHCSSAFLLKRMHYRDWKRGTLAENPSLSGIKQTHNRN